MRNLDPIGAIYAMLAWLQRCSRSLIRPTVRVYEILAESVLATFSFIGRPLKAVRSFRDSLLYQSIASFVFNIADAPRELLANRPQSKSKNKDRSYGMFLAAASIPKELWNRPFVRKMRRSRGARQLGKLLIFVSQVSFVEPMKWLVHLAGLLTRWFRTRNWRKILITSIPSLVVLVGSLIVWYSTLNYRFRLADHYLQLADKEFVSAQASSSEDTDQSKNVSPTNSTTSVQNESPVTASPARLTSYGEMLFRRVRAMHSGNQGRLVIGSRMFSHGAISNAYEELVKIAPDDRVGDPRAHAMVAMIYLNESDNRADPELLNLFRHHAEASLRSGQVPMIVLRALAGLKMMVGEVDQALSVLQVAAEQDASLYLTIVEQANFAGMEPVAAAAKKKGIYRLSQLLESDPNNEDLLSQWAILVSQDEAGIKQAIETLNKHPKLLTSRILSRSLSEVLRLEFSHHYVRDGNLIGALPSLDRAFSIDPSNPNIPSQIELVVSSIFESTTSNSLELTKLDESLSQLLVSGTASVATHAVCSEICRGDGRMNREIMHLQQVTRAAPAAAFYANRLVRLLFQIGQDQEAVKVANNSLSILQERDLLSEPHVDDLLDALGEVYQKVGRAEEAIQVFELSLGFNPSRIATRTKLAAIYSITGDQIKADSHQQAIAATEQLTQQQQLLKNWAATKNKPAHVPVGSTVQ